jgi:hypothetical protein
MTSVPILIGPVMTAPQIADVVGRRNLCAFRTT